MTSWHGKRFPHQCMVLMWCHRWNPAQRVNIAQLWFRLFAWKSCMKSYCKINRVAHDDVIKWKHFSRYWPFVWGIHRSPVNSPDKCQWRGALVFSLICVWINGWVNNREAIDLRRYRAHYDVTVMRWFETAWHSCHCNGAWFIINPIL